MPAAALAVILTMVGCAHGSEARHRIAGDESALTQHRPRLTGALRALEEAVGHEVALEVDGALATGPTLGLDVARELELLVVAIRGRAVPGDLASTRVLDELRKIEVRYEPVDPRRVFDAPNRRLLLRIPAGAPWYAGATVLAESERRLSARYAARSPATIPTGELPLYAWWLIHEARSQEPARVARTIGPLVEVESRLAPEARKLARISLLEGAARARGEASATDQVALAGWARKNVTEMSAEELDALSKVVAAPPELPGLDPIAFILAAADVWVAAGRPVFAFAESDVSLARFPPLVGRVLTPGPPLFNAGPYAAIAASQERLDALFQRVDARRDPLLRNVVALHLLEATCDMGSRDNCARVERSACEARGAAAAAGEGEIAKRMARRCERKR